MNLVKACPMCGNLVSHHCYHEPYEEVYSILMKPEEARILRILTYNQLIEQANELLEDGDLDDV